jgi:DNA-binding transcriptional ArsR family regulator
LLDAFSALAEPRRRKIIEILASDGELSATQIYTRFDITPQAVSQHLKVLLDAVLEMERRSQQHIYQINPESIAELEHWLVHTKQLWSHRLDNLGKLLEAEKRERTLKRNW